MIRTQHALCLMCDGVYNMNCCMNCMVCVLGESHIGKKNDEKKFFLRFYSV